MIDGQKPILVQLDTGSPWHLSLTVERVGRDLVCHVHGGDWHVGAVALAQWRQAEIEIACQIVDNHKEGEIATRTAKILSQTAGCNAVCIAGIHFDDITSEEIDNICATVDELAGTAALRLASLPGAETRPE